MLNPNFTYLKENIEDNRWILLQGSTRSGKTWSIIHFVINFCYVHQNCGIEIDLVRDTFTALKATIWKDFQTITQELGIWEEKNHHKTEHTYKLYGNIIQYYGADNPEKIHGRSRDILIINEANHIEQETIDQLTPRTRYRIIADFNPALGAEHWLDPYIDKFGVLITTYKDNPHLTKEQVQDIESKKNNPYWWTIYGTGQRAKVQGAVFENWEVGEFQGEDYSYGMDFGYSNDPSTLIKVSIDKKNQIIYADECLYETHLTTSQLYEIASKEADKKLIIADSSEPRLIAELRSKGLNIQGAKKGQGSVVEGVVMMNDYRIVITERSKNLRKELSKYRWADKGKTVPIDDNNHCFTGDTLVTTIIGEKKIKDISEGDVVITSNGFNKVIKKWDNGLKQVANYSMEFDTFSLSLESTNSHKIKTEKGWIEISNLKANQKLYLSKYFLERNINSIKVKGIFQEARKGFIELFGNIITGRYKRGMTYTMLMVILQIMTLKTLILFHRVCTLVTLAKRGLKTILSSIRSSTKKELKKRKSGIKVKKVESGTQNMEKKLGLTDHIERLIVKSAVKSIRLDTQEYQNTAIITARLRHLEKGEETLKRVYDLMVENEHEYFANGVLVHNCIDGLRYNVMFYISRPNYGKYAVG